MNGRVRPVILLGFVFLLVVSFGLGSCTGKKSRIQPGLRSIYVQPFKNQSSEPGLAEDLTEETIQEFLADGRLNVVSRSKADAIVSGTIHTYTRIPMIYDELDRVQQYRVRIEISMELNDAESGEQIWKTDRIFRQTSYSDRQPPFETEEDAQLRVLRQLALDVVTTTTSGWPYLRDN